MNRKSKSISGLNKGEQCDPIHDVIFNATEPGRFEHRFMAEPHIEIHNALRQAIWAQPNYGPITVTFKAQPWTTMT